MDSSNKKEAAGIEASLVSSWEGWDEMDTSDLYFYDVELLPGIFPDEVYARVAQGKAEGKKIGLGVWGQTSQVELDMEGDEEPFFRAKVKLVLESEND